MTLLLSNMLRHVRSDVGGSDWYSWIEV